MYKTRLTQLICPVNVGRIELTSKNENIDIAGYESRSGKLSFDKDIEAWSHVRGTLILSASDLQLREAQTRKENHQRYHHEGCP